MSTKKEEIKKLHWDGNSHMFYLEFADGTMRRPYYRRTGFVTDIGFYTLKEAQQEQQKIDELNKKNKWWKLWRS
jgi:hypothetical protein